MNEIGMYKITYKAGKGQVEVIQASKRVGSSWELLKDETVLPLLEAKILEKPLPQKNLQKVGYGEAVYNENLRYITGSFEIVEQN